MGRSITGPAPRRTWGRASAAAGILITAFLFLPACDETSVFEGISTGSGYQARLEEGLSRMDAADWDGAIAVFEEMDRTEEVRRYLSSCYMAKAGFDGFALLREVAASRENGGPSSVLFDAVTRIFDTGPAPGTITTLDLGQKIALADLALGVFGLGDTRGYPPPSGLSVDETFQAGFFAAVRAVLTVVGQLRDPADPGGRCILTLPALRALADPSAVVAGASVPSTLNDDLALVLAAAEAAGPDNDLSRDFRSFLAEIGYLDPAGNPVGVSEASLEAMLSGLL